ncbi:hypothetical protein MBLNU459_g6749t1 [Dothideomycetes sp. NU459]
MSSSIPADAPPPYDSIAQPSSSSHAHASTSSSLHPHTARNGIPPEHRRSMEDLNRDLPPGWVRTFDPTTHHQFFVDTTADPPRSIWHHPYDDEQYLSTLPSEERERIQELHKVPTPADIAAEDTDDEDHAHPHGKSSIPADLPDRQAPKTGLQKFGRKVKDKVTHSTHEEREAERKKRAEEERKSYEAHLAFRKAMQRAVDTNQPQLIGKDREGRDVLITPPGGAQNSNAYGPGVRLIDPYSQGYGGYGGGGYGYGGGYARGPYGRPGYGYSRPYGYGYGGGYGLPLAGGLAGGLLLGGALGGFGGFGL